MYRLPTRYTPTDTLFPYLPPFRSAVERARPGRRPHPHPVLHHLVEGDHAGRRQRRHMLRQQPVEQFGMAAAEVRQTVIVDADPAAQPAIGVRSEEHTSELQSLMRISDAVFCIKKKSSKYIIRIDIVFTTQTQQSKKKNKSYTCDP